VGVEDYDHQHQDLRTEDGVFYGDTIEEMDFAYLAGVTKLNVRALDALARAPMPPKVTVDAAVRVDTEINWSNSVGSNRFQLFARRTDEPSWRDSDMAADNFPDARAFWPDWSVETLDTNASGFKQAFPLRGDDWIFGVASCAGDYCSPVSSAVPGGAFEPVAKE
jgi:hypothetical protein